MFENVSVPYRGYSFFNLIGNAINTDLLCNVSVPYRGYSFFNEHEQNIKDYNKTFPSLTGVIRFLIG